MSKNVLYEKQFGFKQNHLTSHAINYSVDYVAKKIEDKKHVVGLFLGLSKAFDTICHSKLITKLHSYGIRGNCLELLKSYLARILSQRRQYRSLVAGIMRRPPQLHYTMTHYLYVPGAPVIKYESK